MSAHLVVFKHKTGLQEDPLLHKKATPSRPRKGGWRPPPLQGLLFGTLGLGHFLPTRPGVGKKRYDKECQKKSFATSQEPNRSQLASGTGPLFARMGLLQTDVDLKRSDTGGQKLSFTAWCDETRSQHAYCSGPICGQVGSVKTHDG